MRKLILLLVLAVTTVVFSKTYTRDYNPSSGDGVSFLILKELDIISGVLRQNITGVDNITDASIGNADLANNSITTDKILTIGPHQVNSSATDTNLSRMMELIPATGAYQATQPIIESIMEVGFPETGCWVYRSDDDTIGISPGEAQIMSRYRANTSALTIDITTPIASSWYDVALVADNSLSTFTAVASSDLSAPGTGDIGVWSKLVGSIYSNADSKFSATVQYRDDYIVGWFFKEGDNSGSLIQILGFDFGGLVFFEVGDNAATYSYMASGGYLGEYTSGSDPTSVNDFSALGFAASFQMNNEFLIFQEAKYGLVSETGEQFDTGTFYGFSFVLHGRYD